VPSSSLSSSPSIAAVAALVARAIPSPRGGGALTLAQFEQCIVAVAMRAALPPTLSYQDGLRQDYVFDPRALPGPAAAATAAAAAAVTAAATADAAAAAAE
jgi:hypothetical protein